MTPAQIEQMAREAGIEGMFALEREWHGLHRFAELVVKAERDSAGVSLAAIYDPIDAATIATVIEECEHAIPELATIQATADPVTGK